MDWPLLTLTTFLPLVGAGFILLIRGEEETVASNARYVALWTSIMTFVLSLFIWMGFDSESAGFQFVEYKEWLPNIAYRMGVDGISLWFVLLSTFLTPICILASWESIKKRVKEYMIAFLVLETMMVGMFCALDFLVFYVFFEAVLIPMFLIIGIWGGKRRVYASFKFFLYTLLGSVLMLVALMYIYLHVGSTSLVPFTLENGDVKAGLLDFTFNPKVQFWLWLAFFASFAVKIPMWPFHTWLPDAHVEAPTAGSVILAGVLLKMGGYGFLRFSLTVTPVATDFFAPMIFALSIIAIIYTSMVAFAQTDMKKLVAYSSIAHMGFVTLGIFTVNKMGVTGAMFQMLSHGVVSAALFLVVGVVYDRLHTREIARFGGLAHNMPKYAVITMILVLASVGLPGTSGFIGEFMSLMGGYMRSSWVGVFATTGIVLGAVYMLSLYRRVFLGVLEKKDVKAMLDLSPREMAIFLPLIVVIIWMGVYPSTFLKPMEASIDNLIGTYVSEVEAANIAAIAP